VTQAARFRKLLRRDGMIIAPGAYDCITADDRTGRVRLRLHDPAPAPQRRSTTQISASRLGLVRRRRETEALS
jgi:hypothetical protein